MKHYKPGQLCNINGTLYRAKRREFCCKGCALDDIRTCPNIGTPKGEENPYACSQDDIIFVKVCGS